MNEIAPDYSANLLRQYENWGVYLHESQAYLGRTYIALGRDGEIDPFTDTTTEEHSELLLIMNDLKFALGTLYQPDLLNYANLRNSWKHCHWHVIPRYNIGRTVLGHAFEDSNWGKNYAPYSASVVPPDIFEKIKTDLVTELAAR